MYRRGNPRGAKRTAIPANTSTDPTTGEIHVRHHVTADGYYRGKQVIQPKVKVVEED
mgnify:CR=1 FL=1